MQFLLRKSVLFAATLGMGMAAVVSSPRLAAQSATTGAIGGTVSDTGGALLPNTVVTVKSASTGVTRTVKTTGSGDYKVDALQPGTYSISYSADGFQTLEQKEVTVTVGNLSTLSPKLSVGSVTDKVEVAGGIEDIKTAGAEIATTIDQSTIDNLPINGRRYSDFALLTPGVVSNSDGFGLLSFRGISYLLNNTTVDGADDNQAYFSEARGRTRLSYSVVQGAVQEFQVNTSNYSAEYGRAAGGVINTVTKSGSNQLHGEVYFYDRDNGVGGASNPYTQLYNFNQNTGLSLQNVKPKDVRLQYGFGVGGKLIKDKLFWFYAFDQQKRNYTGVARTSDPYDMFAPAAATLPSNETCTRGADPYGYYDFGAPTAKFSDPSYKDVNGNLITQGFSVTANLSTPTSGTAAYYPIGTTYQGNFAACALAAAVYPNTSNDAPLPYQAAAAYYNQGLGLLSTFFGTVPRFGNTTINFPKLDYQVNDKNRITVQYNRVRWDSPNGIQTQTSNFYGRGSFGNDFVKEDTGVFRVTSVLTNTIVNQFLAQYGRDMETEFPSAATPNEAALANPLSPGECSNVRGKPCPSAVPDLSIGYGYDAAGFDAGTSAILSRYALPDERRLQLKDDLTWSRGKHTFKFGLDYNKVSDFINNLYNGYGTYDFDWAYSFIGDYMHATTGLGGTAYAGGGTANGGDYNYGLYSQFNQGYTVPSNWNGTTGTPDNVGASSLIATREYAGYVTDDWRILPRLTLTLGARYEYEYVPGNPTPNPTFLGQTAVGGLYPNTATHPDDRNNIAPRLGFAWNIFGDNKTVLRGGYGIYFGRIVNSNVEQSFQNSGGPGSQVNVSALFSDAATATVADCKIVFPQVVTTYAQAQRCAAETSNASSHPSISYLDPHLQNPQVHEADLDLQQDMGHGYVFALEYMASFGRELDSATDVNVNTSNKQTVNFQVINTPEFPASRAVAYPHGGKPSPIPATYSSVQQVVYGRCPVVNAPAGCTAAARYNPLYYRILRISSDANSEYNALAVQLNKHYHNGFSLMTNFTWAHAMDYNPYIGTGIPGPTRLDPNNRRKDYGNSSLDVRRRFVGNLVYQPQTHLHGVADQLLGGWRFAPVVQIQSGLAYTPYVSGYPGESVSGIRSANGTGNTSGRIDFFERNTFYRPKTAKLDMRIGKNFYLPFNKWGFENPRLEFFAEVFNVFNHQNITGVQNTAYNLTSRAATTAEETPGNPSGYYPSGYVDTLTLQPNFGTYNNSNSNYVYTPRQLQLAARLHF